MEYTFFNLHNIFICKKIAISYCRDMIFFIFSSIIDAGQMYQRILVGTQTILLFFILSYVSLVNVF